MNFKILNHKTDYSSLLHKSSFIEATLCYANPASLRLHKSSLNEATTWTQHERGYNNPALKSLHKPSLNQASKINEATHIRPQLGFTNAACTRNALRFHKRRQLYCDVPMANVVSLMTLFCRQKIIAFTCFAVLLIRRSWLLIPRINPIQSD